MSSDLEKKEDEYIRQITIQYLTNLDYQNDSKETSQTNNIFNGKHFKQIYKNKEKKFYKKRILNIFKLLLNEDSRENREKTDGPEDVLEIHKNEENSEFFFPDIKTTFDVFIKTCINYLKAQDRCDIIQDDYKNLDINNIVSGEKELNALDDTNNNEFNKRINGLIMRKILKKKNYIDSFVKKTPIDIPNTNLQMNNIIPHKKKINLNDPELKIKGLVQPNNLDENIDKNMNKNKNNSIYKEEIIKTNDKNKEKCKEENKKKLKKDYKE